MLCTQIIKIFPVNPCCALKCSAPISLVFPVNPCCALKPLKSSLSIQVEHSNVVHSLVFPVKTCSALRSLKSYNNNNYNNNGHLYGAWSLARSRAQCAVQKAAEKCMNTYNGQNKKGFRPYNCQARKNLHPAISVNKVVSNQTLILAHMYGTSGYTANTKMYSGILHTHTHTGGAEGINYMQIWRDEFLRLAWKKMLILSDEHHMVMSSTVLGP